MTMQPSAQQSGEPGGATRPPRRGAWGAIAATGSLVALKSKGLLGLFKLATLGKFALTALSMLAMVWFEAQRNGVWFGVGFVLLILMHELGHAWAIRRAGLQAGWPVFIPFFGAMIALRGSPRSRDVEAQIAYAGPLAGTAVSLLVAAIGLLASSRLCIALAYTGFFLNLFNLVPIPPLDGGRVATVFSARAWIVGAILLVGLFFATGAPQLLLIGLLALGRGRRPPGAPPVEPASEETKRKWTARYFGLCFFLGAAIFFSQRLMAVGGCE